MVDLTDRASIDRAVEQCGGPIDVLASCAGVADGTAGLPTINFIGQRHLIERAVDGGLLPRGSAIAMVSSAAGRGWELALPVLHEYLDTPTFEAGEAWIDEHPEMAGYAQSKQAVCAYVARQAYGFGTQGIRINALMPGPTDTPLAQANADIWLKYARDYRSELGLGPATAEEQAWILAFLCSAAAARIIGESIVADAGAGTARMMGTFTLRLRLTPRTPARSRVPARFTRSWGSPCRRGTRRGDPSSAWLRAGCARPCRPRAPPTVAGAPG